jgi:type II secretory ATPase GspE/PulE/Tfp pilus assembly ATPase PilB-like protein
MIPSLRAGSTFVEAAGCGACGHTGYNGRTPIFEVMTMTDELAEIIEYSTREIEQLAVSQGMSTLRESGISLAAAGITTLEEVRRVVGGKRRMPRSLAVGA